MMLSLREHLSQSGAMLQSGGADRGHARKRDAAAALPDFVAVETVGAVSQRNPCGRIAPSDLTAGPTVAERQRRIPFAEAAIVRHAVVTRHDHPQRAIALVLEDWIEVIARAHAQRLFE